jgi:hypothetical protein
VKSSSLVVFIPRRSLSFSKSPDLKGSNSTIVEEKPQATEAAAEEQAKAAPEWR